MRYAIRSNFLLIPSPETFQINLISLTIAFPSPSEFHKQYKLYGGRQNDKCYSFHAIAFASGTNDSQYLTSYNHTADTSQMQRINIQRSEFHFTNKTYICRLLADVRDLLPCELPKLKIIKVNNSIRNNAYTHNIDNCTRSNLHTFAINNDQFSRKYSLLKYN